jgi:hypothetical protein
MPVTVSIWQDNSGVPGAILDEFADTISAVNTDGASTAAAVAAGINQKYAGFTPISLAANTTYWIGMSGGNATLGVELGQTTLYPATYGSTAQFGDNDTFEGLVGGGIGDTSMRLYGPVGPPVPDSGLTIAMLGMSISGLAFIRRKL